MSKTSESGFIALISAIILSAIIIVLSVSISQTSFLARFDELNHEFKKTSVALAETCVNISLLNIGKNPDYDPGATGDIVSVGEGECTISVVSGVTAKTINVCATYKGSVTNLEVEANFTVDNYTITDWTEWGDYDGPGCDT